MSDEMTMNKFVCLVNLTASLLWIGGTMWYQPELQFDPKFLTYNGCTLFLIGVSLFVSTTLFSLYAACKAGAPFLIKALLSLFLAGMLLFTFGVIGLYPALTWGQTSISLILAGTIILMLVSLVFIITTFKACTDAGSKYWACLPFCFQFIGVVLFHMGAWIFRSVLEGQADVHVAVYLFQAASYFFPMYVISGLLFTPPTMPRMVPRDRMAV